MGEYMKRTLIITVACALGLMLSGVTAQATPLTYGDEYYLGSYMPNPADPTEEALRINILNDYGVGVEAIVDGINYSRVGSTLDGSFPDAVFGLKLENVGSIDATGFQYVLAKYGGGQDGYSLVWFLSTGFAGEVEPPARYDGNGLSHIDVFTRTTTTVPDGGITLMLLGGALVGIGALRRKFRA